MHNKYKNIVIPVDLAHDSSWRASLPEAIEYARNHSADLHVVTVVPNADIPAIAAHLPDGIDAHIREDGLQHLQSLITQQVPTGIRSHAAVGQGSVPREVLRIAKEVNADLIVMSSHRPELKDYVLGANAAHVMRHADCSVLVIRDKGGLEHA
ncbi:universal stress protein [Neptunomonas marina]|nr:universal stress protein [Neptunomonas marina]